MTDQISDLTDMSMKSKQKFDGTLSGISDAVISIDKQGMISFMNPMAELLTGWRLKEAYQKSLSIVFKIINGDTRQKIEYPLERIVNNDFVITHTQKTILIRIDGVEIPIDESEAPIRDDHDNILGTVITFRDITVRKECERKLMLGEARLKRSQEIAKLGSWELDLKTNCLTWSDEIFRIFGLNPQEFEATYEGFLNAVHPDDRALVDCAYTESLKSNSDSYEVEHRIKRKDNGAIRYVHEKCFHTKDENGKIIMSIGMVHDITERKMAELALKDSEERIKKKIETILYPEG